MDTNTSHMFSYYHESQDLEDYDYPSNIQYLPWVPGPGRLWLPVKYSVITMSPRSWKTMITSPIFSNYHESQVLVDYDYQSYIQ